MLTVSIRKKLSSYIAIYFFCGLTSISSYAGFWITGPVFDAANLEANIVTNISELETWISKSEALTAARKANKLMSGAKIEFGVGKTAPKLIEEQKLSRKIRNSVVASEMQPLESICRIPTGANDQSRDAGFWIGSSSKPLGGILYINPIDDSCSRENLIKENSYSNLEIGFPNDDVDISKANKPYTLKLKSIASSTIRDDGSIDKEKVKKLLDANLVMTVDKLTLNNDDLDLLQDFSFITTPIFDGITYDDKISTKLTAKSLEEFALKNTSSSILMNAAAERVPLSEELPSSLERKQGFVDSYYKSGGFERFAYGKNMYTPSQVIREQAIIKGFSAVQAVDKYKKLLNEEFVLAVRLAQKIK
jgi:hypothetical protein